MGQQCSFWYIAPMDGRRLQLKFGGMSMLASRLRARMNVRAQMWLCF
jgi:hypothetical protein